mmetsp:Transcript_32761/g.45712  ORF Transcript_32761/g.45712 Transcript_32761/m.45712 type:complete len:110 (+) Transcript_32761:493-822(+)
MLYGFLRHGHLQLLPPLGNTVSITLACKWRLSGEKKILMDRIRVLLGRLINELAFCCVFGCLNELLFCRQRFREKYNIKTPTRPCCMEDGYQPAEPPCGCECLPDCCAV